MTLTAPSFSHLSIRTGTPIARGVPTSTQVLTELGWLSFDDLAARLPEGTESLPLPDARSGPIRRAPSSYGHWLDAWGNLPRVAEVIGGTGPDAGQVRWTQPTALDAWEVTGFLIGFRRVGLLRFECSESFELLTRGRYQRAPKFVSAEALRLSGIPEGRRHWQTYGELDSRAYAGDFRELLSPLLYEQGHAQIEAGYVSLKSTPKPRTFDASGSLKVPQIIRGRVGQLFPWESTSTGFKVAPVHPDGERRSITVANLETPTGSLIIREAPSGAGAAWRGQQLRGAPVVVGDGSQKASGTWRAAR